MAFLGLLAVLMIIVGIIGLALPAFTNWILSAVNMPQNIYSLLIELPRPLWDNQTFGPQLFNSSEPVSGYSGIIGQSMTHLYAGSKTAAFALLAVVLVVAGLSFFLQNFRILGEGTAVRILTGSIMAVVFIFVFPYIYDAVAATVNSLTYPSPHGIIPPGAIDKILESASAISWASPPSNTTTWNFTITPYPQPYVPVPSSADVGSLVAAAMMNIFLFIFLLITYASVAVMGILRIFFIGAAFALMPARL